MKTSTRKKKNLSITLENQDEYLCNFFYLEVNNTASKKGGGIKLAPIRLQGDGIIGLAACD